MNRSLIDVPNDDYGDPANAAVPSVSIQLDQLKEASDLSSRLTQNGALCLSGLGDRFYTRGREFEPIKSVPIPQELLQQMHQTRGRLEMGLFPEIGRAWVTIDCDVFMWNYETNDDLAYFDGVQSTIIKIALARPKAGVFQPHVHWVLIVATILDVQLFAVTINQSEVSIIPDTLFKVDIENAVVRDIKCTETGRIFYASKDVLFELEYYDNGWLRRHCKKINRSTNLLQSIIPFLSSTPEDITQIVVDDSRHILFTLTVKGSIQVYDLGVKGQTFTKVTGLSGAQIIYEASMLSGAQHDPSMFSNLVRIIPLTAECSHHLNLMAITAKGVRLYLSVLPKQAQPSQGQYVSHLSMSQAESRPLCLRICHVRFSPGICPTSTYRDQTSGVYMAQANNSTCLFATHPEEKFLLHTISDLYHPAGRVYVESINEFVLNGPVWAMHLQSRQLCSSQAPLGDLIPPALTHPFYRIHANAAELVVVLTSEGITIYQQRSPVVALRDALAENGFDSNEIEVMWRELGPINALVLTLMLLASEKPTDQQNKDKALRLFYSFKDEPEMVDVDQVVRDWNDGHDSFRDWNSRMRSPLRSSTPYHERAIPSPNVASPIAPSEYSFNHGNAFYQFRPSKRHDALYAYFARLVAPLWNQPIALTDKGRLQPLVTVSSLNWLSHQLRLFLSAIEENNLIPRQMLPQSTDYTSLNAKFSAEAHARERASFLALHALIIRSLETLALWGVAVEYGMQQVSANIEPDSLRQLAGRRLCDLVTCDSNLNNDLIKGLIRYFLGDEAGTKELSDRLRNVCPTLYSQEDALVTNASEMLERAARLGITVDSRKLVATAVLYLKQSINKISLSAISQQLAPLEAYDAIVELCLLRAKNDDPKQLAIVAYRNGMTDGNKEMAEVCNRRENAYAVIRRLLEDSTNKLDAQTIRDQIIQCVLSSDDELAHASLFRWMLQNNRADKIIESKSQYIEQFLTHEICRGGGHKYLDLLWRFYQKTNSFDKAAKLLSRLAENTSIKEISLDQRISYLSTAIVCAQSATDPKIKERIQEMRDKLEVAYIQSNIRDSLKKLNTPQCKQAVAELEISLLSLQTLCEKYIHPFGLNRIMLAAFRCAALYKEDEIQETWANIIDQELHGPRECAVPNLLTCIKELSDLYKGTNYFPEEFIVIILLQKCRDKRIKAPFFELLIDKMDLTFAKFFTFLGEELRSDPIWSTNSLALRYAVDVIEVVVSAFMRRAPSFDEETRLNDLEACRDMLSLITLLVKKNGPELGAETISEADRLDALNARLKHGKF